MVAYWGSIHTQVQTATELRHRVVCSIIHNLLCFFLQKQFTKMANTKLKKKKKGVIAANGLNNDAGTNDKLVTIRWLGVMGNAPNVWSEFWLFVWLLTSKSLVIWVAGCAIMILRCRLCFLYVVVILPIKKKKSYQTTWTELTELAKTPLTPIHKSRRVMSSFNTEIKR